MDHLQDLPLTDLAKLYRKTEVSPVEITKLVFERQRKLEPALNAFTELAEEDALLAAETAEKRFLAHKPSHLLTGVPYSAKDLFYTKGIRTTCASPGGIVNIRGTTSRSEVAS